MRSERTEQVIPFADCQSLDEALQSKGIGRHRRFNLGTVQNPEVLASTLRDLEENGFVSRTVTPTNPPQVEYALTELGQEFLHPVRGLAEWVLENAPRINEARSNYAARRSPAD